MNILEDLWYGQICPVAQADYRDSEYRDLVRSLEGKERALLETLSQQQQALLEEIDQLRQDRECRTECAAFITGFRLAVRLLVASV